MELQNLVFCVVDNEERSRAVVVLRELDRGGVFWQVHVHNDPTHLQEGNTPQSTHWNIVQGFLQCSETGHHVSELLSQTETSSLCRLCNNLVNTEGKHSSLCVCLLTESSSCSNKHFSGRVKSIVWGGNKQPSTLIFSRLVSFSGQKGTADYMWNKQKLYLPFYSKGFIWHTINQSAFNLTLYDLWHFNYFHRLKLWISPKNISESQGIQLSGSSVYHCVVFICCCHDSGWL